MTTDYQKLFVVEGSHLHGYDVDDEDHRKLTEYKSMDMRYPCDNVNPSPDKPNELLVGCIPKPLSHLTKGYPYQGHAAMIRKVDIGEGTSAPFKTDNNGSVISGVTGALNIGAFTVGVSVFDPSRYMVCSDFSTIKISA